MNKNSEPRIAHDLKSTCRKRHKIKKCCGCYVWVNLESKEKNWEQKHCSQHSHVPSANFYSFSFFYPNIPARSLQLWFFSPPFSTLLLCEVGYVTQQISWLGRIWTFSSLVILHWISKNVTKPLHGQLRLPVWHLNLLSSPPHYCPIDTMHEVHL